MCSPAPPPPPDFAGAAQAQGTANVDAARTTGRISNPNIRTPYGRQTVRWNGDRPTITQTLSPEQQKIFDINQGGQLGLAQVGSDAVGRIGGILGQEVNFDKSLGTQSQGRQEVIDAMMSRYDTDMGRRKDGVNSDLIARGIAPGTEAYSREMEMLGRGRNDALQQATISADGKAMDERRQSITELMAQRQTPLNEISALRTGSQVAPMQFQPFRGSNVDAAPVFGATQAQYGAQGDIYNAQVGQRNQNMQSAAMIGGAAMMMF